MDMQVCEDQGEALTLNARQYFVGDCVFTILAGEPQRQLKWVSAPFPWQLITWLLGKTNEDCVLFHYDMSVVFFVLSSSSHTCSVCRDERPNPCPPAVIENVMGFYRNRGIKM